MSVVRVGIVGAGPMGRLHARTVARRASEKGDCALTAIMDRHPGRAAALAEEFGGHASSHREALVSNVDAVVVCVPTWAHYSLSAAFLERDLDLLVEKPLAHTVAQGERLAELALARGRILQVGHVEWYNPAWREAAERVGTPRSIVVDRLHPRSERGLELDVVQDSMIHDLDWVTRWLGDEIVELEASGRCVVHDKLDEAEAHLTFRSGCRATLRASRVHAERRRTVRIEGSDGVATADLLTRGDTGALASERAGSDPLEVQWARFLECLRDRKEPQASATVGLDALRLVERVREAIAGGATRAAGSPELEDDPALRR